MGGPFSVQYAVAGHLRGTRDTLVGSRDLRRDELFSRFAHTRDRAQTRRWRTTPTGVAVDSQTRFAAHDRGRCIRTRRGAWSNALVVRTPLWRDGFRSDDVCNDLPA